MLLEAFGVKNLRCLTDTGLLPIRPITVLVGKNSSGKSTFLRAFPLLRQSVETLRNSPVLWYGQYVDFGSLSEAASYQLKEPSITLRFKLDAPAELRSVVSGHPIDVAMTLSGGDTPYVSEYEVVSEDREHWHFDQSGNAKKRLVNGRDVPLSAPVSLVSDGFILRTISNGTASGANYKSFPGIQLPAISETVFKVLGPKEGIKSESALTILLADFLVSYTMRDVAYLAPLRVSAQRSYRVQNVAIDEVDPDGSNFAMFLRSLTPEEIESFAAFTRRTLGFEVKAKTEGLHTEIMIREEGAPKFVNLVDVGFGYSEVLPLAAVVWSSCLRENGRTRRASMLALEQPELHLHPAYQSKLADLFAEALPAQTPILVETHSQALVNRLGELIEEGRLQKEDVVVLLFELDPATREASVRESTFDAEGVLTNWPIGFFAP